MEDIARLEKPKGTFRTLAHINEKSNSRISDIIRDTGLSSRTIYIVLRRLIELGLITQELSEEFPSIKCYKPTEEGRRIADHIEEIRKIVVKVGKKR